MDGRFDKKQEGKCCCLRACVNCLCCLAATWPNRSFYVVVHSMNLLNSGYQMPVRTILVCFCYTCTWFKLDLCCDMHTSIAVTATMCFIWMHVVVAIEHPLLFIWYTCLNMWNIRHWNIELVHFCSIVWHTWYLVVLPLHQKILFEEFIYLKFPRYSEELHWLLKVRILRITWAIFCRRSSLPESGLRCLCSDVAHASMPAIVVCVPSVLVYALTRNRAWHEW